MKILTNKIRAVATILTVPVFAWLATGCGSVPTKTASNAATNTVTFHNATVSQTPASGQAEHTGVETFTVVHHTSPGVSTTAKRHHRLVGGFYVPILELHDTTAIPNDPYTMSPEQFTEEMTWLKDHDFHTVTLQQVYDAMTHHTKLPTRPIVLTFDDGYESNFTTAFPVLKQDGFVATEFVISNFVNKKGFLTEQQLLDMQGSGVFQIESHTLDHPNLAKLNRAKLVKEIFQSKAALVKDVGRPILFFCYPYGAYNPTVINLVHQAGYLLATSTDPGYANPVADGPYRLKRIAVHQGLSTEAFAKLLAPSLQPASTSSKM